MEATLNQATKLLSVFKNTPVEQVQEIIGSGRLADLRDGNLAKVSRDEFRQTLGLDPLTPKPEPILKLISAGHIVVLGACNGRKVFTKAKNVFPAGIKCDLKKARADEPGQPTPETLLNVYEMVKNATLSEMFGSLNVDAGKLCLTQHQIIDFVKKYPDWLRADVHATLFLFKSYGCFFAARAGIHPIDGLFLHVFEFDLVYTWFAGYRHRVVVPQLALAT